MNGQVRMQQQSGCVQNVIVPISTENEKRCSRCGETKPVSNFYAYAYNKDGFVSRCKKCLCDADRAKRGYIAPKRWKPGEIPQKGDMTKATNVGHKSNELMIWTACPECGAETWKRHREVLRGEHLLCRNCSKTGEKSIWWSGGKTYNSSGYINMWLPRNSFYYPMTKGRRGRVLEHRLVIANHIGRCLTSDEVVHHINGIRHDNRIENLELVSCKGRHNTRSNNINAELIAEVKKLIIIIEKKNLEIMALKNEKILKETT